MTAPGQPSPSKASLGAETLAATTGERPDSRESGTVLCGRYELRGLLGVGGMGSVYRAWDRELDELVALKMLREGVVAGPLVERFRKEVKLARRVTHRNVARTFDIGEDGQARFLTMELIDGVSLDAVIADRAPLPLADARAILIQICEGLAAAHTVDVVHRDLKPANVMVESTGRIVVTDFGLARRVEVGLGTIGATGQVLGTPAYMAPEQVAGLVEIDARADVYALGLIAHELLLGRPAWSGGSALQVAAARLYEPPPEFADVPSPLRELLCRCLLRERDHRFADAGVLLSLLRAGGTSGFSLGGLQLDSAPARETRIAVLPFAQGRGTDAILDGLAEDLADVLSMTPGLRVRHSAPRQAPDAAPPDPIAVGRTAGVDVVVAGSVRRHGDKLRVNVRLLGTSDGYQLWAGRFDRRVEQALALNDEVAAAVAEVLTTKAPAPRQGPTDPRAVELYLRARKLAAGSFMDSGAMAMLAPIEEALRLAPEDPKLLGMWVFSSMAGRNFEPCSVAPEVERALARLITHAPDLVGTHLARAAVLTYGHDDRAAAVPFIRRGLRLSPNNVELLYLFGVSHYEAGRLDQAVRILRQALWIAPQLPWVRLSIAVVLGLQGRWTELVELVDGEATGSDSTWARPRTITLARVGLWAKRELGPIQPELVSNPVFSALIEFQARAARGQLDLDEARTCIAAQFAAAPVHSRGRRLLGQLWTEVLVAAGALDDAITTLETTVESGLGDLGWLDDLALLDPLRARPEFLRARETVVARATTLAAALDAPID